MATTEKTTKVELVVNDETKNEVEVSEIVSVEIRGATGVATYRLDPNQDVVIKLVVVGKVAQEDDEESPVPVSTEQVIGHFGKPDDVKALKEREAQVEKDRQQAQKDQEEAAKREADKAQKSAPEQPRETVNVGKATTTKP